MYFSGKVILSYLLLLSPSFLYALDITKLPQHETQRDLLYGRRKGTRHRYPEGICSTVSCLYKECCSGHVCSANRMCYKVVTDEKTSPPSSLGSSSTSSPSYASPTFSPSIILVKSPPSQKPSDVRSFKHTPSPSVELKGQQLIMNQTASPTDESGAPGNETSLPTSTPTDPVAYRPGDLTVRENGLLLSTGLTSTIIASSGEYVRYSNGDKSTIRFHDYPDAGATFASPSKDGSWVYVSNSEHYFQEGGVGAITFNPAGQVVDYQMILTNTSMNCGGGKTPWNTWVSCEEYYPIGHCWETDPFGVYKANRTQLSESGGNFESVAYDDSRGELEFFVTEDKSAGPLRRFQPDPEVMKRGENHTILTSPGTIRYLKLDTDGTFYWTSNKQIAKNSAYYIYPNSEGIDVRNGKVYFTAKWYQELFILDLNNKTWTKSSTESGAFEGQPDQIASIVGGTNDDILYFCEDGWYYRNGVHGRDKEGRFFTILNGPRYDSETTGLAFSPDKKHMYVSYQYPGYIFDITRLDGRPFDGDVLDIKYHDITTVVDS